MNDDLGFVGCCDCCLLCWSDLYVCRLVVCARGFVVYYAFADLVVSMFDSGLVGLLLCAVMFGLTLFLWLGCVLRLLFWCFNDVLLGRCLWVLRFAYCGIFNDLLAVVAGYDAPFKFCAVAGLVVYCLDTV